MTKPVNGHHIPNGKMIEVFKVSDIEPDSTTPVEMRLDSIYAELRRVSDRVSMLLFLIAALTLAELGYSLVRLMIMLDHLPENFTFTAWLMSKL